MSFSNERTFRNYARVQDAHDKAFDRAFAIRREAERLLKQRREAAQTIIAVSNEKRDLPF